MRCGCNRSVTSLLKDVAQVRFLEMRNIASWCSGSTRKFLDKYIAAPQTAMAASNVVVRIAVTSVKIGSIPITGQLVDGAIPSEN